MKMTDKNVYLEKTKYQLTLRWICLKILSNWDLVDQTYLHNSLCDLYADQSICNNHKKNKK